MANNIKLDASMSSYGGYIDNTSYGENMKSSYQYKLNSKFDHSTSIRTISEEYPYGSGNFRDLLCRVVSVRTVGTGSKMSDSYKTIIFKDQKHPKNIGYLYKFEDNYWIACNSDIMSSATDSIVVRRCNNVLRWKDDSGNIQSVPISFEENAFYLNNSIQQDIDSIGGYRKAIIQRTEITNTIKPNQRFIFGNTCLKISGSGVSNFLNQYTEDDDSPSIIRLNFEYDLVNPATDDMENKIANAFSNEYSIEIDQKETEYSLSTNSYKFTATILNNGYQVSQDLVWEVLGGLKYSISKSGSAVNIIFKEIGKYKIYVRSKSNESLKTYININVTNVDRYTIQCSPILETIYKGDTAIFEFSLYKNGEVVNDALFEFKKTDTLSEDYYTYSIDENSLYITNHKMTNSRVKITCKSTNYINASEYVLDIRLGGKW